MRSVILEFKCVCHFFLDYYYYYFLIPCYVPEATGGGLASSLCVYDSHSLKYIVFKSSSTGAFRNQPI